MTAILTFPLLHPLLAMLFVLWGKPRRGEWTISKRLKRPQTRNQRLAEKLIAWINKHDSGHV